MKRSMGIVWLVWGWGFGFSAFAGENAPEKTLEAQVVETKAATSDPSVATGDTVCTNGANRRIVALVPGDAATKAPCEVHYKKETEQPGHDQVLWSSANNPGFCVTKAQAFVEKLSGMGWSCGKK